MLDLTKQLKELEKLKNNLEKRDEILIISDFDDTLFCRKEQLEISSLLRENRGKKGNEVIMNVIGLENFINEHYIGKKIPKNIINSMKIGKDLILTAGLQELQDAKLKAINLHIYNYIVVDEAEKKIYETIRYVVKNIGFIPKKIVIYEDKPEYFIENKKLIEDFLGTELEIILVEMIDNQTEPNLKKIA
ncbi:MAG: hypothetical protein PHV23_00390 [Candidatus Gracilibacteria bacterium]|nr:hypothetical protein [Candidatus Gracilibacteria bacterium]